MERRKTCAAEADPCVFVRKFAKERKEAMRSKGKKLLAGFLAVAMSLSVSLSALPALALGAGEGEPPLHLQDGWVVKKGDAVLFLNDLPDVYT